jgi:hypothetical protein
MKIASYLKNSKQHLGINVQGKLYNIASLGGNFPSDVLAFLDEGETAMQSLQHCRKMIFIFWHRFLIQDPAEMDMLFANMLHLLEETEELR